MIFIGRQGLLQVISVELYVDCTIECQKFCLSLPLKVTLAAIFLDRMPPVEGSQAQEPELTRLNIVCYCSVTTAASSKPRKSSQW
mmetsp:Transcript_31235/g.26670  ORF Transcript_31235/g.26670 Transcript_31235/m.26670 type:complete len:85 (+) Transcript_31235:52-306(+)